MSQTFEVPVNCAIVWKARVKQHDIGFVLRQMPDATSQTNNNNNTEGNAIIIQPLQRFSSEALIQGQLAPTDKHRNINLFFDNTHSHMQRKTIVFWVAIGRHLILLMFDIIYISTFIETSDVCVCLRGKCFARRRPNRGCSIKGSRSCEPGAPTLLVRSASFAVTCITF